MYEEVYNFRQFEQRGQVYAEMGYSTGDFNQDYQRPLNYDLATTAKFTQLHKE